MGWLNFFRKREAAPDIRPPSAVVQFDEEAITCMRPDGLRETVRWSELKAVLIQTTANGPLTDDMFWVLVGRAGGCVVPSEAQGCDRLLERLQRLPGFDNKAVILASQSIDEGSFLCWEQEKASWARDANAYGVIKDYREIKRDAARFAERTASPASSLPEADEPNDVDVILVMRNEFRSEDCPSESLVLFDHARADAELGASVFWVRPDMLLGEPLEQFLAFWQTKRDGRRRGVVEIRP